MLDHPDRFLLALDRLNSPPCIDVSGDIMATESVTKAKGPLKIDWITRLTIPQAGPSQAFFDHIKSEKIARFDQGEANPIDTDALSDGEVMPWGEVPGDRGNSL